MIDQSLFIGSLQLLRSYLQSDDAGLENSILEAHAYNPWFIPEFSRLAINSIADKFLEEVKYRNWISFYELSNKDPKTIAIIMAGNVPLVGFHDLLCVLAAGHNAMIKLSDKDSHLLKFIISKWVSFYPPLTSRISYVDKLEHYDAVIATGSNNSARYFEYYFRDHPHILRKNRNGVAVIDGSETSEELEKLSDDIFLYFGLGCRNVSKVFVPDGYDFNTWPGAMKKWNYLKDHNKYRNNLDYNAAIYIINQVPHINMDHLILKEDDMISSRIGCVHYSFYKNKELLLQNLNSKRDEIQCLISNQVVNGWQHVQPGMSQYPALHQYADGVDTMQFLTSL